MRYLKQRNLSRRIINDTTVYSDVTNSNVYVYPSGQGSLVLPTGPTSSQPGSPVVGMMRYDTNTNEVMVYQGSSWRAMRFKEATQIIQQNLGAGDGITTLFGPLNGTYYNPTNVSSDVSSFGGQNVLVVVENVLQLSSINYTVVNNPTVTGETYNSFLSVAGGSGSSTLYFNTSLNITSASWTTNVATLTFSNTSSSGVAFATGSTITVTGITSTGQTLSAFNGIFTVTGGTSTTVTYALTTNPGSYENGGNVTASGSYPAVFPAVNIVGATVSGTNIFSGATVTSYTTDPNTDALTSITMSHAPTGTISVNSDISIAETNRSGTGYYLQFTSAVPYGKVVIALLGFDQ
jgi:hypothetical protein